MLTPLSFPNMLRPAKSVCRIMIAAHLTTAWARVGPRKYSTTKRGDLEERNNNIVRQVCHVMAQLMIILM